MHNHTEFRTREPNRADHFVGVVRIHFRKIEFAWFGVLCYCCSSLNFPQRKKKLKTRKYRAHTHTHTNFIICVQLFVVESTKNMCVWKFLHLNWLLFFLSIGNLETNAIPESITMRSKFYVFFSLSIQFCSIVRLWYGYHCATSVLFLYVPMKKKQPTNQIQITSNWPKKGREIEVFNQRSIAVAPHNKPTQYTDTYTYTHSFLLP